VYHLELRQFPHSVWRFNLTEQQLRAIVAPWLRGQLLELGEHKWNPEQAKLTILEGPELALGQLTMGRGWRAAQRSSEDVTERVLASAPASPSASPAAPASASPAALAPSADAFALGVQMAALLGPDAMQLLEAWRVAAAGTPGLAPSETLALAERAIRAAD
jgi:hypothetical protein